MTEKEIQEIKNKVWREGYDLGVQNTLKTNDKALKIGQAILNVLDERYEFQIK